MGPPGRQVPANRRRLTTCRGQSPATFCRLTTHFRRLPAAVTWSAAVISDLPRDCRR